MEFPHKLRQTIPQKIRVAHVAGQLAVGGMEKLLVGFARHADRSRFELFFVSLGDRGRVALAGGPLPMN